MFSLDLKPTSIRFFNHLVSLQRRRARSAALREADASRDAKLFQRAAEQYGHVVHSWGADFDVLVQWGNMLKDSGALDQAEAAYNQALLLNPLNADCHLQFGHLMKVAGRLDRAEEYYLEARRLEPARFQGEAELKDIEAERALRLSLAEGIGPALYAREKGGRMPIMRSRVMGHLPWRRN